MEINGIAHVILTVRSIEKSREFYVPLCEHFGLTRVVDAPEYLYYVGGRTALGLRPAAKGEAEAHFYQERCGLHHVCFRARSREDVDSVHLLVARLGGKIVHGPQEDGFAPGYYSVLFEDPDGIRLEVNHVPGKGLLEPGVVRGDATSTPKQR
jgi:catechol 2,3-dioxygenase-like lactoylglutathione lyase family enzyme